VYRKTLRARLETAKVERGAAKTNESLLEPSGDARRLFTVVV
jgi:hypothetical protein